jgi:dolichol kinase
VDRVPGLRWRQPSARWAWLEWSALADLPIHHRVALQVTNLAIVALVATLGAGAAVFIVGGATLAGMLWPVIRADPTRAMRDLGFAAIGVILLPGMLAHGIALVVERGALGSATFVALAIAVAAADVCAFLVGRRFGRTPLAPRLSPAKTRAGAVGSLIGAAVGIAVFAPVLVMAFAVRSPRPTSRSARSCGTVESAPRSARPGRRTRPWLPGFRRHPRRVDSPDTCTCVLGPAARRPGRMPACLAVLDAGGGRSRDDGAARGPLWRPSRASGDRWRPPPGRRPFSSARTTPATSTSRRSG